MSVFLFMKSLFILFFRFQIMRIQLHRIELKLQLQVSRMDNPASGFTNQSAVIGLLDSCLIGYIKRQSKFAIYEQKIICISQPNNVLGTRNTI